MSIIIQDLDFVKYAPIIFNLEAMKLAAYYKKKKKIVYFPKEIDILNCEKIFVRQDFSDGMYFNKLLSDKILYGGYAFTKKYSPLKPEIEISKPDSFLYNRYSHLFTLNTDEKSFWRKLCVAEHLRISLDEENIWEDYLKQIENIDNYSFIIHDKNIVKIKDGFELVKDLLFSKRKKQKRVGFKYPILIEDLNDIKKWNSILYHKNLYQFQLNNFVEDNEFNEITLYFKKEKNVKTLFYNINFPTNEYEKFIIEKGCQLFLQMCFCINNQIKINLVYDNTIINTNIKNFFERLKKYVLCAIENKRTEHYSFATYIKGYSSRRFISDVEPLREMFYYIRDINYDLFKMFYSCTQTKFSNGRYIENG